MSAVAVEVQGDSGQQTPRLNHCYFELVPWLARCGYRSRGAVRLLPPGSPPPANACLVCLELDRSALKEVEA